MAQTQQVESAQLVWHDILELGLEGCGWSREQLCHPYDRLPAHAKEKVTPGIWDLAQRSAGLMVRFQTDAPAIHARWKLRYDRLAMNHMAATGVSGLDLYVRHQGQWRWLGVGRPEQVENQWPLVQDMEPQTRQYQLLLPLYNGVESVEIGIPPGHTITPGSTPAPGSAPAPGSGPASQRRPICMYGTSILQGACASRPGMAHSHILSRRLDRPVINLGFSGSARCEPELAQLLAELDPAVYVLEPLPNMQPQQVRERIEPFVATLRQARPKTPIVLVDSVFYTNGFLVPQRLERYTGSNRQLAAAVKRMQQAGIQNLHHVTGQGLLGDDGEATVDGTHATDLGFVRMADVLEPVLRQVLSI